MQWLSILFLHDGYPQPEQGKQAQRFAQVAGRFLCLFCSAVAGQRTPGSHAEHSVLVGNFRIEVRKSIVLNPYTWYNKTVEFSDGGIHMAISYNKLWKLLIDRKMSKADLRRAAGIAPNTMTKLNRDEEVTLETLGKICTVLKVNVGDIVDIFPEY